MGGVEFRNQEKLYVIYKDYTISGESFTDFKLLLVSVVNKIKYKSVARQALIWTLVFENVNNSEQQFLRTLKAQATYGEV